MMSLNFCMLWFDYTVQTSYLCVSLYAKSSTVPREIITLMHYRMFSIIHLISEVSGQLQKN